jgi:hypothetical protein
MNIQEARAKLPALSDGLDDGQFVDAVHQMYYPDMDKSILEKSMGYTPPTPPVQQAGVLRTVGDMGIKAAQGVVDYGKSVVGRADMLTGGAAGNGLRAIGYDPEATNQFLGQGLSDSQNQSDQNVANADGFVDKIVANVKNPRALMGGIVGSLPGIGETMAVGGLVAGRIAIKAALATDEGAAAAKAIIEAGGTEDAAAKAALEADAATAQTASTAAGAPVMSAAQTALESSTGALHAAGAADMGSQSTGNIAENAAENGRDYSDYALPALAAGAGTGALTYATGRLMGSAKMQLATGSEAMGVTGSKLTQVGKEMLHQGVLQGMPQAAQEQYFTNIANGEPDLMKGVTNAAGDALVNGAVMGGATGAFAHGNGAHGDATHDDPSQVNAAPMVLADTGVLSQAANAGQAALAEKQDLSKPLDYTQTPIPADPAQSAPPLSLYNPTANPHPNAIDYTAPEKTQNTSGLQNLQTYSSMGHPYDLDYLQEAIPRMNASGQSNQLTIIPHAEGDYTVAPTSALSQSILTAVQHLQAPAEAGSIDATLPPVSHQALQDMATTRAMSAPTGFGEHAQMESLLKEDRDRAATAQAEQSRWDALQQNEAIKATDARTAAAYQQKADANRAALRNQVLDNDAIPAERKKDAYAAALKRDGYINPRLTDEDHVHIDDAIRPEPSAPNELVNAVPEKIDAVRARAGKANTDAVDTAIAQGMRLKTPAGNILHKPGSTKIFKLNDGQKSYYQQAIKARDVNGNVRSGNLDAGIAGKNDQGGVDYASRIERHVPAGSGNEAAVDGLARPGGTSDHVEAEAKKAPLSTLDLAAHAAATSPHNDLAQPTEAQKEAGNYAKGHVRFDGMDISIENPAGSTRSGIARDGTPWETTMQQHYGYIKGTVGMDKDHIDTFIGKNEDSKKVFVVDQVNPDTGKPDEHKVMLGFDTMQQARDAYQSNYDANWRGGKQITETSMDDFKAWLKDGKTKQPIAKNAPEEAVTTDFHQAIAAPPGLEKARRLKAERDSEKQRIAEHDKGMEQLAAKWSEQDKAAASAAELEKRTGPDSTPEKSAEDIAFDNEMSDAMSHLGDVLGDVFGAKLNITGQQHTAGALLPALSKVIELLVRKGARSLQQAVSQASKLMRANPAVAPHVDKISPRQWKAAYNAIAEFHEGTDSESDVANTHPDDVTAYAAPAKPTEAAPVAAPAIDTNKNQTLAPIAKDKNGLPIHIGDTVTTSSGRSAEVSSVKTDGDGKPILHYQEWDGERAFERPDKVIVEPDDEFSKNDRSEPEKAQPDIKSGKEPTAASDEPAAPALTAQELNRLSVKDMSDDQLWQAKDTLPKREKPIAKEIALRGLTEPKAKEETAPTADEIKAEQDGDKPLDRNVIAARYAQLLAEGRDGVSPVSTEFHYRFADDLISKDAYRLKWITNGLNDKSKKVFAEFTGVKLPKAQGASWEALKEWAGVTPEQDKAHNEAQAALLKAKQTAEHAADAERNADNQQFQTSAEDKTLVSGKDVIDRQISEGFTSIENISKSAVPKYALVNHETDRYYPLDKVGRKYAEVALTRLGESAEATRGDGDKLISTDQAAADQIEHERELAAAKANGQTMVSDADAAHLFGKDAPTTTPEPELPRKPLSEIRIAVDVKNADTGKSARMSVAASVAMRDVSDRIKSLEDLIACMKG